jgi:2-oxoglutarate ferredoxin oxidoreductase subunit alpha
MIINQLNFMVGGKAGEGVDSTGLLFAKLAMRSGLWVHGTAEFYSVIKGYNNIYQVRVGEQPLASHINDYDLVLALDKETTDKYLDNVVQGGGVIYDPAVAEPESETVKLFPVPLRAIAKEKAGMELAKNVVGMGAVLGLLDAPIQPLLDSLVKQFAYKGEDVVNKNMDAAQAGYHYIRENFSREFNYVLKPVTNDPRMLVNGNEIISLAAMKAGCKFVSEYPMTPSSSILHCMARHSLKYQVSVNHVEDEISAINMAVGAGYAGVRSMTGTSGGGFSLMSEAIGLAGMIEAPVVIVDCQRPGPSTGLPTRSGQGDLRQAMHASQGDFPRVVLSPGTHEEAFYMTFEAFNLAEKYQCPVILLSEKYLSEGHVSLPYLKTDHLQVDRGKLLSESQIEAGFQRFKATADGVSRRTIPGQSGGAHTASSYEHREDGYFTEEVEDVIAIQARRMKKLETIAADLPPVYLEGEEDAELTLVCWGATYGPTLEAIELLSKGGVRGNLLHIKYLQPLQAGVAEVLEHSKHPILVEGNISAQLGGLIAEKVGIEIQDKILDWSGRPFTPSLIVEEVLKMIRS